MDDADASLVDAPPLRASKAALHAVFTESFIAELHRETAHPLFRKHLKPGLHLRHEMDLPPQETPPGSDEDNSEDDEVVIPPGSARKPRKDTPAANSDAEEPVVPVQQAGKQPRKSVGGKDFSRPPAPPAQQAARRKQKQKPKSGQNERYKRIPCAPLPGSVRKVAGQRRSAGLQALHEIKHYQGKADADALIPWAPFTRLVKEIAQDISKELPGTPDIRFQASAVDALRSACEAMVTSQFLGGMHVTVGAKRQTLLTSDLEVAWKCAYELRNESKMIHTFRGNWKDAALKGNPDGL